MTSDINFSCTKCPRVFKLEEFYEKHLRVHELKKQHLCSLCGFVYGAAKGLEGHISSSHLDKKNKGSSIESLLVESKETQKENTGNEETEKNEDEEKEKDGGKGETKEGILKKEKEELSRIQNEFGFFTCQICTREFTGYNSLKKHLPIHSRRIQHKCSFCGFVFGKKEYLTDHMRKHTGENSPMCSICGQSFNKSLKLKEHSKLHRSESVDNSLVPSFKCHMCSSLFLSVSFLQSHLETQHSQTLYNCELCKASFGDVRGRNHHMYNEHSCDSFAQKVVWCPICLQGFTRTYNLKVHIGKAHGKEFLENNYRGEELKGLPSYSKPGPKSSKLSSPAFSSPSPAFSSPSPSLNSLGLEKKNSLMISCSFCTDKFLRKTDLYIHVEATHDVTLFPCDFCSEKFLELTQKKTHVKVSHVSRRPGPASKTHPSPEYLSSSIQCSLCDVICSGLEGLKNHVVSCPNKESHVKTCELCSKAFSSQESLNSHIMSTHPHLKKRLEGLKKSLGLLEEDVDQEMKSECNEYLDNEYQETKEKNIRRNNEKNSRDQRSQTLGRNEETTKRIERQRKRCFSASSSSDSSSDSFSSPRRRRRRRNEEDQEEDETFEAITEEFYFENIVISPCYVVLPYVTNVEIQAACSMTHSSFEDCEEEIGQLTIDESGFEEEFQEKVRNSIPNMNTSLNTSSSLLPFSQPKKKKDFSSKNKQLSISEQKQKPSSSQPFSSSYKPEENNHEKEELIGFYPNLSDFSLPFSLSGLWKKKAELLGPEAMKQAELLEQQIKKINEFERKNESQGERKRKGGKGGVTSGVLFSSAGSPSKSFQGGNTSISSPSSSPLSPSASSSPSGGKGHKNKSSLHKVPDAAVSNYESKIQSNEVWPLNCIKCSLSLGNLECFNLHMNDHWTNDKCCPVCGLLINSKRFNFKQHLKIHTGEKPFVCNICSRSFRQKAHMVKHVTTHRSLPNPSDVSTPLIIHS